MRIDKEYICLSPYLKLMKNDNVESVKVMNHMTSMVHIISKNIWNYLSKYSDGVTKTKLCEEIGQELFDNYLKKKIIMYKGTEWTIHQPRFIEIETSSYCNWKCNYCPNSIFTQDKKIMPLTVFKLILDKAVEYGHIRFISLHGYNEPTIEPFFLERARMIKDAGFKLVLFTNGSGLKPSVLEKLMALHVVRNIVFNLPSVKNEIFIERTGVDMFDCAVTHIQYALRLGFRISISVQGTEQEQALEVKDIESLFPDVPITAIRSFDRAGIMINKYCNNVNHTEERLSGCGFVLTDIHIDVNGRIYLCLEDYHKKNILGNIEDKSFSDILESEVYINIKKQIWGQAPAAENLICRRCILMENQY